MKFSSRIQITLTLAIILFTQLIYAADDVKFYSINTILGISMREANSVCKDEEGFIWASSINGILRLTDDDYRVYQLPNETSDYSTIKLEYENSQLIAYTNNGQVFKYNTILDQFDLLVNLRKQSNSVFLYLSDLIIDNNSLWFATSYGIIKYNEDELIQLGEKNVNYLRIIKFDEGRAIVSTKNEILYVDIEKNKILKSIEIEDENISSISGIFHKSQSDEIWLGTMADGLYRFNVVNNKFSKILPDILPKQPILDIEFNTDSTIFIGYDGQGIWEIDINNNKLLNVFKENIDNPNSLKGNGVYDIFNEGNGRIWISTYSGGVSYFENNTSIVDQLAHKINNPNSLVNNDVNCLIQDADGKIWMGTNNGISCWNPETNVWNSYYSNKQEQAQVFLTLCEDKLGRIWAGTYSSGIYLIDSKTGKELKHYSSKVAQSPIKSDFVFNIFEDDNNDIWIGGINTPVFQYNISDDTFKPYGTDPVNAFAKLSENEMLLGCTYGLSFLNKENNATWIFLNGYWVNDVLVSDSTIWACTSGDGLICFNRNTRETTKYTAESGLPTNYIKSLRQDGNFLWLGTENGICRFNITDKSVETYSSIQNLSQVSFNRHASCRLNDGRLAWGTNNGVILFNPANLKQYSSKGKIYIQEISVSGSSIRKLPSMNLTQPLNEIDKLKLNHNQNTLTLEILPIGVAPGSKLSWQLEGIEENWSEPSNQRIITYLNIKSIKTRLKIRLYDSSLSQIIDERVIPIQIKPPFWETWYFFSLIFVLITAIIYLSLWYYINHLKQKHAEEKVRFFTNTAHDLRTSLTLIKAPIEELSKEESVSELGKYYLKTAKEQTTRLSSVVNQLMDFQKADIGKNQLKPSKVELVKLVKTRIAMFNSYAQSRNIQIIFTTHQTALESEIDEQMIEKVVDNLLSNAIKYSNSNSEVNISLSCNSKSWILTISDNGIGISTKDQKQLFKEFFRGENAINNKIVGSGIGLLLVKNYVKMHNGDVRFTSNENSGSTFTIEIPLSFNADFSKQENKTEVFVTEIPEEEPNTFTEGKKSDKMRILIVDDNDDLRDFLFHALEDEFETIGAEDGNVAWEIVQDEIPDLIVSDIMMPNLDGFEFCKLIKSTYETSHIPVILLTALSSETDQLNGLGLGADDYMIKPFDVVLLKQKIKTIIQNRVTVRDHAFGLRTDDNEKPILNNRLNDKFMKRMIEVVNENINNHNFNKNAFAAAMNVSESLLYKKVKALTDQSPNNFIKLIRLNYALKLLEAKEYNVTEVSDMCGFNSVSYFCTVFKKHFGKSPTEY